MRLSSPASSPGPSRNPFLRRAGHTPPVMASPDSDREADNSVLPITDPEMGAEVARMCAKSAAPGPDGMPNLVLALVLEQLGPRLKGLFYAYLASGQFPGCWKEGKLVRLPKPGRSPESASAFRPIVLLDDTSKLLERVLAVCIARPVVGTGPDLSDAQFGSRRVRSTIAALRAVVTEVVTGGEELLAVSLDIIRRSDIRRIQQSAILLH